MSSVFTSLLPVFLVIAAGWLARTSGFVEERDWAGLERITYVIFFPAIIVDTLARADLATVPVLGVGGALVITILMVTVVLLLARGFLERRIGLDGPSFTSLLQGCTRWNSFVALALAGSLFGPRGLTLMAVAIAAMVPLLNVIAVSALTRYAAGRSQGPRAFLRTLALNPFIWASALGLALNPLAPLLPKAATGVLDILGRASLGAGLIVVGAGLDLGRLARPGAAHLLSVLLKLVILPIVAVAIARAFGIDGDDLAITIVAASVPTASGAYLLAKQMGGNAAMMAEIITVQTVVALATMPLMMAWLAPS